MCDDQKIISKFMTRKIAQSGLSYQHLKLAYLRDTHCGLKHILSEKVNGQPRVTNRLSIVESINQYFKGICK